MSNITFNFKLNNGLNNLIKRSNESLRAKENGSEEQYHIAENAYNNCREDFKNLIITARKNHNLDHNVKLINSLAEEL